MKPFNDEDLIAYHLHELAPRRARALEQALKTDPSLAAEFEAYRATLRAFKEDTPPVIPEEVMDRTWEAVRPSLKLHATRPAMRFRWQLPALVGGGLAFAGVMWMVATHEQTSRKTPLTSSISKLNELSPPPPASDNSLTQLAPPTEMSGRLERRDPLERSLSGQKGDDLPSPPHRRISYLSLATEPAMIPRPIPLASTSIPVFPEEPSTVVTMAPDASLQTVPNSGSRSKRRRSSVHHEHVTDLTLSIGGTLIGTREGSSSATEKYFQGATHAVSAMAAFHQQLRPLVGYRLTGSYTRPEFQYMLQTPSTTGSTVSINSRVYELAATYVVQGPHHGRISTSAEAGAGFLGFLPTASSTETSYNLRGAGVLGAAAEVALTKRLALHVAYRGQVFKGPDFKYTGYAGPAVTATLFSNEPTVGITYRFSHR